MPKKHSALDHLLARAVALAFAGQDYCAEISLARDLAKLLEREVTA